MHDASHPASRVAIVAHWDRQGRLPGYARYFVERLAEHAEVAVVVNGSADAAALRALDRIGVVVLRRENTGLDVGAWRYGIRTLADRIAAASELVLTNTTIYGPVDAEGFSPLFAWARAHPELDLWGITDHLGGRGTPGQPVEYPVPSHLQSYWLAARASVLSSPQWAHYWRTLDVATYRDAVLQHEHRFTEYFTRCGFSAGAAYPADGRTVGGLLLDHARSMIETTTCPVVKRRAFFHEPSFLPRESWPSVFEILRQRGYPVSLIIDDLRMQGLE